MIKIGNVEVTQDEFDQAFQLTHAEDNAQNRRMFMEQYVNQKLILMEAEHRGLDQDPQFLNEIQTFWEDRLLKTAMLLKFEEHAKSTQATDAEVDQIYEENKTNKSLPADSTKAKDQIRGMIAQEKQNKLLVDWLDALRKKTNIYVDEHKLGLNPQLTQR